MPNSIYCPCNTTLELSAQATCLQCKRKHLTTSELRSQLDKLYTQLDTIRNEVGAIQLELFKRERRRTQTDIYGHKVPDVSKEGFWKGVRKAPREDKPKKDYKAEALAALGMV